MLYKVITCEIGTEELDIDASKLLSRYAKKGFIVKSNSLAATNGKIFSQYLMQRVPITHIESEEGDPKGLKRIRLGNEIHYWDPCGEDDEPTDVT
jgi:hypothetical protein